MLRLPAAVFDEWRLLFDNEPWGDERAEYLHGIRAAIAAGEGKPPTRYMPFVHPPKATMSSASMLALAKTIPGVEITEL